jgi:hypothetical protein
MAEQVLPAAEGQHRGAEGPEEISQGLSLALVAVDDAQCAAAIPGSADRLGHAKMLPARAAPQVPTSAVSRVFVLAGAK